MAGTLGAVIQIVGTVVGAYFGYPYLGSLIGGIIGGAVDPSVMEGPRLGDLLVRASTYGKNIPIVYGRENRIGGNIIWNAGIVEHENKSRDFLGGTEAVTYSYTASFAVALGQGVMRNVQAIYANGKLIWERQQALDRLAKYKKRQEEFLDTCLQYANPAHCTAYTDSLDYLDNVNKALEMPDFEPWILRETVSLSSDGRGEYADRAATMWLGGAFRQMEWFPGTNDQPKSLIMPSDTPAYRNTAYIVFKNMELARFGNQIPTLDFVISGQEQETLADVLSDICRRAGADLTEVVARGALSEMFVRGYAIGNARSAISAIQPLMIAYPFDACDHDGTLRFTPRSRSPIVTIPEEDMGARAPDSQRQATFPIERIPNYELPSESSVTYSDPANAYQPGTQISIRSEGDAQTKLNNSLPLTFTAKEAKAIADRLLSEGWLSRDQIRPVFLSSKYDFLQPGDIFAGPVPGGYAPYRILEKTRGDNGIIELTVLKEDRTAYEGDAPGADPFVNEQQPPDYEYTLPYLFNAPIMAPNEDNSGFSFTLDSPGIDWPFGDLYRSTDNTSTWDFAVRSTSRGRIAYLTDVLDVGPSDLWDRTNVIGIAMFAGDTAVAPESVTEEVLLANPTKNLLWVGAADGSVGELIQYATVAQQSDGRYLLSNLLRGRRATEYAIAMHGTDETAVFIPDSSTGSLDYGVGDWGLMRFYMALSASEDLESGAPLFQFTGTGERLKPRSPVLPSGSRDGTSNLTVDWVRRTRLFAPPMGYGPTPLGEAFESYELDIIVAGNVVRTIAALTDQAYYSAADQTVDGITPGNPVSGKIYQLSATFGRGHAADFTV